MKAVVIPVTPYAQNCTVMWCEETMLGAVSDPGGDIDRVQDAIAEQGVTIEKILLTHGHLDHAGGTAELAERLGVPIEGPHPDDLFLIEGLDGHASKPGFEGARSFTPNRWLESGDGISFGKQTMTVRHCPGHTPGHVVFHSPEIGRAFVGDVLFAGSIGRTDFPQGDHEQLLASIRERLWPMGDATVFIPGHGPESSFGRERRSNPYVRDPI